MPCNVINDKAANWGKEQHLVTQRSRSQQIQKEIDETEDW